MFENRFRTLLEEGRRPIQGVVSDRSPGLAEMMGKIGFDSIFVDWQHGPFDYSDLYSILVALSVGTATPIVRVPWNDPGSIMKVLDTGALGIVCPLVNTRAEAEAFVGAVKYPPLGYRSVGPIRLPTDFAEYRQRANREILAIAQIETVEGLANVDEIVATPGLDALFPGPSDLSMSAGDTPNPAFNYDQTEPAARLTRITEAAHAAGLWVGLPAVTHDDLQAVFDLGADWAQWGHQSILLATAAGRALADARKIADSFSAAAAATAGS